MLKLRIFPSFSEILASVKYASYLIFFSGIVEKNCEKNQSNCNVIELSNSVKIQSIWILCANEFSKCHGCVPAKKRLKYVIKPVE